MKDTKPKRKLSVAYGSIVGLTMNRCRNDCEMTPKWEGIQIKF